MNYITPIEITPTSNNTWQDRDLTSYLGADAGDVAGVVIQVCKETLDTSSAHDWGVRKNGSTDGYFECIDGTWQTWLSIGVDSGDIVEIYTEDRTVIKFYLLGYFTNSEAGFITNRTDKTPASGTGWLDCDISSDTGTDTAKAGLFLCSNDSGTSLRKFGLRQNGSTDDYTGWILNSDTASVPSGQGGFMSCDANEVLEVYIYFEGTPKYYLVGYVKGDITTWTNAKDYSTATTESYTDVDFSSDIPTSGTGAFWQFDSASNTNEIVAIRKNGSAFDKYFYINRQSYGVVEIDTNRVAEQEINETGADLYLWGYSGGSSGTTTNSERDAKTTGKATTNSERDTKIVGKITTNAERDTKIAGKLTSYSLRSAKAIGIIGDIYTRQYNATLPTNDDPLSTQYVAQDYTDVGTDDTDYVGIDTVAAGYMLHQFEKFNTNENNTDTVSVSVVSRSTLAPSTTTVYLQIYNRNSSEWETLDSDNATGANTDFTLSGTQGINLSNYYDVNYVVALRIYQQAV